MPQSPTGASSANVNITNATLTTAVTGDVEVVQPTGLDLHTVVDSGTVTVSQATGANLHAVVDSGEVTIVGADGTPVVVDAEGALRVAQGYEDLESNPQWGSMGPLAQMSREQSNFDEINSLLTHDTNLGRLLGSNPLVDPVTKSLNVQCTSRANQTQSSALSRTNQEMLVLLNGANTVAVQLYGTWAGTANFEVSIDGQNWSAIYGWGPATVTLVTTATANGAFGFAVTGFAWFRVRLTWTSGTCRVLAALSVDAGSQRTVAISGTVPISGTVTGMGDAAINLTANALLAADPWYPRGVYAIGDCVTWLGQTYQCIAATAAIFPLPNNATYWRIDQRQNKSLVTNDYISKPNAARVRVEIDMDGYQYRLVEDADLAARRSEWQDLQFQDRMLVGSGLGLSGMSKYTFDEIR